MRLTRYMAIAAILLGFCGISYGQSEVGSFPNAAQLGGAERILADQNGNTVNLTPAQIGQYLGIPNGIIFPLPIVSGGTGANTAMQAAINLLPTLISGDCLSNSGGALLWQGCGGAPGGENDELQYNADGSFGGIGLGTADYPLISNGSSGPPTFAQLDLTLGVTNVLPVANGGTGTMTPGLVEGAGITITGTWPDQTVTASGGSMTWPATAGIPCYSGSSSWCTSYSTSNTIPADYLATIPSTQISGLGTFATANYATPPAIGGTTPAAGSFTTLAATSLGLTDPLTVANGGLGLASITQYDMLLGNGTSAPTLVAPGTATYVWTSNGSGAAPTWQAPAAAGVSSLTAGGGIAVSGSTGAVTVSSSYTIRTAAGATDTISSSDCANGVYYDYAGAVAVTLPQATGSFAGCSIDIWASSATTVTITPTTSTINGGSTLAVGESLWAQVAAQSGNYLAYGTATAPGDGGSGTVNNCASAGYVGYYAASGTAVSCEQYVTAAQSAAISGDVTKAAGSAASTVTAINGGAVPTSATALGTNSTGQPVAASTASILVGTTSSFGGSALTAGACTTTTLTVTGATTSMAVVATPVTYPGNGSYWFAYVSAANTVTAAVCAVIALTPTASAYNVRVIP